MDGHNQYYYGNYRYHYRHLWTNQSLTDSLNSINRVDQEDRISVCQKLASQTAFTGLSILHRLFHLYQFDILKDLVFDCMHTLILRVVNRHLH